MKNKFVYLLKFSLKKKIDTKWFKIVNVLLCLLLIFLINMDFIINFFGGNFNETKKIYVVDNINKYNSFATYFANYSEVLDTGDYELILDNSMLSKKSNLNDEIIVVLNANTSEYLNGEIISYDTVSRSLYEIVINSFNSVKQELVLDSSNMSPAEIAALTSPVNVAETVLNNDTYDNKTKEKLSATITTVLIVPFFILIVSMVQMLGAEINDEKTSRGMEIIISSVPAKMHFLSKVLSALCYVLIEGCLLLTFSFIALLLRNIFMHSGANGISNIISNTVIALKDAGVFVNVLKGAIPLIILFLTSFILYATVSATLASMTTNNEDFQQLQTPLMIIMMVGYYLSLMAVAFDGSIFINIMAYLPFLSVLMAPTLYLIGEISLISLIAITIINVIVTYFIYKYSLRIYKVGILNYSSTKLWHKIFKSLKNK